MRFLFAALFIAPACSLELTPENWDEMTAGKTVFVKYFAEWCGHCKRLKPAWDKLTEKYSDSSDSDVLVAEVDCTGAGKPLCNEAGVKGFPTLKYGPVNNLQDYKKGRDFDVLDTFTATLEAPCNIETLEHCSDNEKNKISELKALDANALKEIIDDEKRRRKTSEENFEKALSELQAEYTRLKEQHEDELEHMKRDYAIHIVKDMLRLNAKEAKSEL